MKTKFIVFLKKILRNLLNVQNILFQEFITLEDETELIGAGLTEATILVWGYGIFSIMLKKVKK